MEKSKKKLAEVIQLQSPFLDVREAGLFLKVKRSTIYGWIHKKRVLKFPVRYHGRKPVFLIEDLKRWSDERNGFLSAS